MTNITTNQSNILLAARSTVGGDFQKVWEEAIDNYQTSARLSDNEKAILLKEDPSEALQLAKVPWKANIIDKRLAPHDLIQCTVSQVLGIFDSVTAALGLAQMVPTSIPLCPFLTLGLVELRSIRRSR
jgi:hypothetical protein